MPDPAPTRRESSKAVPVGEPPTPEGWTPQDSRDVVLAIQVVYKDSPGKATRLVAGLLDQMRPVGGAGQELHEAAQAFLDAYIDTDREHTTGEWEVLDAAEEELRQALAAGVGGAGVRLTEEEMKALLDPRGDWDQALGSAKKKLLAHLAASVGRTDG